MVSATTPSAQRAEARSIWSYPIVKGLFVPLVAIVATLVFHWWLDWNTQQQQSVYSATIRAAAPLLLGAMVGILGERSGIVNIGIEGQLTLTGFAAFFTAAAFNSLLLGALAALIVGALTGAFMGWSTITIKMDHIIAGTVLNIFAVGFTNYYYVQGKSMPRFPNWSIPVLDEIPLIGRVVFSNGPMVYVALAAAIVLHIALNYTRWGLRTKAVGEHPSAVDSVGVSVIALRYRNIILAGMVAGLGGLAILSSASSFSNTGFSSGRGFIALAVMLFGRYRPFGALGAALLFGYFTALQGQLQITGAIDIPTQFTGMIPYLFTIVVLAVLGYAARPPAALGSSFEKE